MERARRQEARALSSLCSIRARLSLHELLDYVDRCSGTAARVSTTDEPTSDAPAPSSAGTSDAAERSAEGESEGRGGTRVVLPRLLDLIPEALRAAELILRDEKYAETIRDSPAAIGRILSLLERLKNPESLKLTMAMLSRLGMSREARREIGRLQGFRTLIRLVVRRDDTLSREVLRTTQTLLSAASDEPLPGAEASTAVRAAEDPYPGERRPTCRASESCSS